MYLPIFPFNSLNKRVLDVIQHSAIAVQTIILKVDNFQITKQTTVELDQKIDQMQKIELVFEQVLSLTTLSYWKVIQEIQRKHLIEQELPNGLQKQLDITKNMLSSFVGEFKINESVNPSFLHEALNSFTFKSKDFSFSCTKMGNILHESSVDNQDTFDIGIKRFHSQIHEGDILQETSFNKEIVNCERDYLLLTTEDLRDEWFPENMEIFSGLIKQKVEVKLKIIKPSKTSNRKQIKFSFIREVHFWEGNKYVISSTENLEETYTEIN